MSPGGLALSKPQSKPLSFGHVVLMLGPAVLAPRLSGAGGVPWARYGLTKHLTAVCKIFNICYVNFGEQ